MQIIGNKQISGGHWSAMMMDTQFKQPYQLARGASLLVAAASHAAAARVALVASVCPQAKACRADARLMGEGISA